MKTLFSILILLIAAVGQLQTIPQPEQRKPEPLTLWGITMDAPPPQFPSCGQNIEDAFQETRTCVFKSESRYVADDIWNLLGPKTRSVAHITEDHGNVAGFSVDLSTDDYPLVLEALTRKLGKPSHSTPLLENGFGATWQADIYQWDVVDGSFVELDYRNPDSDERKLFVLSAESMKKRAANKPAIREP